MSKPGNSRKPENTDAPIVLRELVTSHECRRSHGEDSSPYRESFEDEGRILKDWVESHYGRMCSGHAYRRGQWKLASALIQRCAVQIAAYDQNPRVIIGWCCTSLDAVHYVHVDQKFRRQGVMRELLNSYLKRRGIIYTHAPSRMWQNRGLDQMHKFQLVDGKKESVISIPEGWTYNPFHAFEIAATVPAYRGEDSVKNSAPAQRDHLKNANDTARSFGEAEEDEAVFNAS